MIRLACDSQKNRSPNYTPKAETLALTVCVIKFARPAKFITQYVTLHARWLGCAITSPPPRGTSRGPRFETTAQIFEQITKKDPWRYLWRGREVPLGGWEVIAHPNHL